jgi:subtilisin
MRRILQTISFMLALLLTLTSLTMASPPEMERYIVVLNDRVKSPASAAREIAAQAGGQVGFIYEHALKGFSLQVPAQALAALERNPHVKYVDNDYVRHAFAQEIPTGIERIFADTNTAIDMDGSDDYRVDVDVAVIDTGVDFEHPDLNVAGGVNCTGRIFKTSCVSGGDDDHYHGTHVAGTVGALDNGIGVVGVAPGARIWSVKVLDKNGSGWSSWIIAGIDWVAKNAGTIEVANMSLGGSGFSQAEYDAIQGAVNKGVAFAVAAGNEDDDAAYYSPAAFDNVLTVSALADFDGQQGGVGSSTCRTDEDDTLANFSNWGPEVDIAAPGVCILSTYPLEKGGYGTISGTSMASPHVAGALALLASVHNPSNATDVYNLYDQVVADGNFDWTDDSGDGILEPFLDVSTFSAALIATGAGADDPPTVIITSPTDGASFNSGYSISFAGSASDNENGDLAADLIWTSDLDDQIGTGGSFSRTLSDGPHKINAKVTDSAGNTSSDSITITVGGTIGGDPITLSATSKSNRTWVIVDLSWSGATSPSVDILKDGDFLETTSNDGSYTDKIGNTGSSSAKYKVCEFGSTTNCSNEVTVSW